VLGPVTRVNFPFLAVEKQHQDYVSASLGATPAFCEALFDCRVRREWIFSIARASYFSGSRIRWFAVTWLLDSQECAEALHQRFGSVGWMAEFSMVKTGKVAETPNIEGC